MDWYFHCQPHLAFRGKFREMMAKEYTDLTVLSIAANGKEMSFSSDTGMAECLVIARKVNGESATHWQPRFTSIAPET